MPLRRRQLLAAAALPWLPGCARQAVDPEAPTRVRVSAVTVPNTPWHRLWLRFAERAGRLAADALDVRLHVRAEIGSEEVTLSALRRGRVQLGGYSLQGTASVVPELNVLMAPYLFGSLAEIDHVIDRHLTPLFERLFAARGLALLSWAEVGWVHLYGRRPFRVPEDVAGVRMRTSTALAQREFARALGMDGITLPFPEVLPALQTGLIEGGQSGTGMYALAGLAREAPVLTRTYHAFDTGVIIANRAWFEGLRDDRRALLLGSLDPVDEARADVRESLARYERELLPSLGATIVDLDAGERARWAATAAEQQRRLVERVGGEAASVLAAIEAGRREYAAIAERG
jgi:TRAP-type C4-dicarboxylate transport system substrate-binding protein